MTNKKKEELVYERIKNHIVNLQAKYFYIYNFLTKYFKDNKFVRNLDPKTERYGYYFYESFELWRLFLDEQQKLKKRSIIVLDLGIGWGLSMNLLKQVARECYEIEIKVIGVEIIPEFADVARKTIDNSVIYEKDITKVNLKKILEENNIEKFDIIYSWNPITKKEDCIKFFKNITRNYELYDYLYLLPASGIWENVINIYRENYRDFNVANLGQYSHIFNCKNKDACKIIKKEIDKFFKKK